MSNRLLYESGPRGHVHAAADAYRSALGRYIADLERQGKTPAEIDAALASLDAEPRRNAHGGGRYRG